MPDIQFKCPHCRHPIVEPFEMLGQLIDCPSCNETIEVQKSRIPSMPPSAPLRGIPKLKLPKPPPKSKNKGLKVKEYKVLTKMDPWFAGNYAPEKMEAAMNHYAAKGWQVVSIAAADSPANLIVVMGRNT